MANLGKLITGGARTTAGQAGGESKLFVGKSRRGRPKASPADKAAAKFHGFKTLKAWKEAGSPPIPKRKSSTTPRGSDAPKRTRREKKELARLVEAQTRDNLSENTVPPLGRRTSTTDSAGNRVEGGVNTSLLSKEQLPEKLSPAQLRRLVETGQATVGRGGKVRSTGQYASGADVTGSLMRGGDAVAPTENEIIKMGGFDIRKAGGAVKKKKKKTKRVGVGKALRGYGAVRKG
tara:strand:- start:401 stop:1102 length:702 start_codon:yes stop_codon:yes gene_type:complete